LLIGRWRRRHDERRPRGRIHGNGNGRSDSVGIEIGEDNRRANALFMEMTDGMERLPYDAANSKGLVVSRREAIRRSPPRRLFKQSITFALCLLSPFRQET
jgi:hypothetical protein